MKPASAPLTRRDFLHRTSGAALATLAFPAIAPSSALGQGAAPAANSRIQVAAIGTGPQGRGVMGNFLALPPCRVIAVCDTKTDSLERARHQVNTAYKNEDCKTYGDFREVLARPDIDAVLIATPDHWHVPVAIAAAKAGKDMYVEKPLGLTIEEDQMLRKICQKNGRIFQFGTQQRSSRQFWQACQLVRNGHIGQLKHINVWAPASTPGGSTTPIQPPSTLNYEMWLGPAPSTPYTDKKADEDGKTWWFNYDYALGFIAGWGVHPLDIAFWGCPSFVQGPLEVEGRAVIPTEGACNTSVAWEVDFKCADGITMKYKGSSGGFIDPSGMTDLKNWEKRYGRDTGHGTAFEGSQGWIMVDRSGIVTHPESLIETKFDADRVQLVRSENHVRNLLDSIRSRKPAVCPIEDSVEADILCHLSDIATRVRRRLTWDPKKENFVKDADANARLKLRKMRKPWAL